MPVVLFGLLLSILVMLLFGGTEIDRGLLMLLAEVKAPGLKAAAGVVEWIAQPLPLAVLTGAGMAWLLARRQWRPAFLLGSLVLSGWAAIALVQQVTASIRPGVEERVLESQMLAGFPNGEVAHAALVLLALPLLLTGSRPWRSILGTVGAFLALAIGWARLLRGESWPSDVIAGWGVALLWVLVPLRLAGHDIGDGTQRPLRHSPGKETTMENPRTETARRTDDRDLIENLDDTPASGSTSGGNLQRDIGSRDEMKHGEAGEPGIERVRDSDKSEGENLPRYNER